MTITDEDRIAAEARMQAELKNRPKALRARYDLRVSRIVIGLDNGLRANRRSLLHKISFVRRKPIEIAENFIQRTLVGFDRCDLFGQGRHPSDELRDRRRIGRRRRTPDPFGAARPRQSKTRHSRARKIFPSA
jgi:hypothetical protein